MIRIEINKDDLFEYVNRIESGRFKSPTSTLADWVTNLTGNKRNLVQGTIDRLTDLITATPIEIKGFINQFGTINDPAFNEEFVSRMRYENFRKSSIARWFSNKLDLKTCPYCNAQFIVTIDSRGKLLCHFDHIYPKNKYPYLALTAYNLIPCCANCNQAKSTSDPISESSFHHPYERSFADSFMFKATIKAIGNFQINGRTNKNDRNLDLEVLPGNDITYHQRFLIQEIHNQHHDIIDEIYLKNQIYNSTYYDELKQRLVDDEKLLSEAELHRIIYSNYMSSEDINNRPLSKMTQDLIEQFKNLNF